MGKKLVEILAENIPVWPDDADFARQDADDEICFDNEAGKCGYDHDFMWHEQATDNKHDGCIGTLRITKPSWESERARYLSTVQPVRDEEISRIAPVTFTESDIRAAFAAGANWVRGGIEEGAVEYVNKLKGDV